MNVRLWYGTVVAVITLGLIWWLPDPRLLCYIWIVAWFVTALSERSAYRVVRIKDEIITILEERVKWKQQTIDNYEQMLQLSPFPSDAMHAVKPAHISIACWCHLSGWEGAMYKPCVSRSCAGHGDGADCNLPCECPCHVTSLAERVIEA